MQIERIISLINQFESYKDYGIRALKECFQDEEGSMHHTSKDDGKSALKTTIRTAEFFETNSIKSALVNEKARQIIDNIHKDRNTFIDNERIGIYDAIVCIRFLLLIEEKLSEEEISKIFDRLEKGLSVDGNQSNQDAFAETFNLLFYYEIYKIVEASSFEDSNAKEKWESICADKCCDECLKQIALAKV